MTLANSMPADKWRWMQKSFIWLRRRFPRQRDIVSKDGDAIRPIERISNGEYSRLRCNKDLANYVMPGTVVRVTNARVLGSSMTGAAREHYADVAMLTHTYGRCRVARVQVTAVSSGGC